MGECEHALQARKLLEGLPQVNESAVSDAKMGVFTEMFIGGGIGGDLFEVSSFYVGGRPSRWRTRWRGWGMQPAACSCPVGKHLCCLAAR